MLAKPRQHGYSRPQKGAATAIRPSTMPNARVADTYRQLEAIWTGSEALPLQLQGKKYAIISDVHLGNGGKADNFRHNHDIFLMATGSYLEQGHHLILAGDTEDLWQFDLQEVRNSYDTTVYDRLRHFSDANRLTRVFGNHDREWGPLRDPAFRVPPCHGHPEAVKLTDSANKPRVMILHGHQGTADSDKCSWASRFFVHLYRYVEPYMHPLSDDPAATRSDVSGDYERMMYNWAKAHRVLLICGHSHRAVAASLSYTQSLQKHKAELETQNHTPTSAGADASVTLKIKEIDAVIEHEKKRGRNFTPVEETGNPVPCYFNTGCCCYADGMTAIEIASDQITLVKWSQERIVFQSMPLGQCLTSI